MPPEPLQTKTESRHYSSTADDSAGLPPVNLTHDLVPPPLVHQDPIPTTSPVITSNRVPLSVPSSPILNQSSSAPANVSQHHSAPISSPSDKRPWFNMFSWSIGKESVASTPTTPDIRITSLENRPNSESRDATKFEDSTGVVGDCGSHLDSSTPPAETVTRSPHSTAVPHPKVDSPPVHEQGTISLAPPDPLPCDSPISQTQQCNGAPVVPNSKSVFKFNFPMLTKPRPLPEATVTPASQEPSSEPSPATSDPGNTYSMNMTETTRTASTSTAYISDCSNQSPNQSTSVTEARADTWWAYLGWHTNIPTAQMESGAQSLQPIDAHVSSAGPEPAESPEPGGERTSRVDLNSDVTEGSSPSDKKRPSAGDIDSAGGPPTWYAPWSWYQSPPSSTAAAAPPGINLDSQQDPPELSQMDSKTEEKRTAGDHAAHANPDQVSTPRQDPSATGSIDYTNPIQSAISANPTGWMSFFTAKAIAMKSVTYEKEGNMEVMEIDDEMAPGSGPAPSLAPTVIQPSPTQVPKPPVGAQPHTSDVSPTSSPLAKKSDDKRSPVPHAATNTESVVNDTLKRQPSPSPSKKSSVRTPASPPPPNLVLPTWTDTFYTLPRSAAHRESPSALSKTLQYVSGVLFPRDETPSNKGKGKAKEYVYSPYDKALPRTWDVVGGGQGADILRGCKRAVIIGVHGWFPGAVLRTLAGEPTGTSSKFVNGIVDALDRFQEEHKVKLDKVTKIPLEGEGTITRRVERLYQNLIGNKEWVEDLHDADAIFIATHSQGTVVSTHLLDRLIADRHIRTSLNPDTSVPARDAASASVRSPQRICCLALCGIHLGPLRYLGTSSLVQPYIQYFESTAARELFEFQNTESAISQDYVRALRNVLNNGIKMVYIASLNDQVVGLYSGLFTSVSHPLILRALYIDGDAYHPSDFLSNLLVLLLRIRNAGLSDGGLLTQLSEVTAGTLNGVGHSTPYEERATYALAVDYLFLTDNGTGAQAEFVEEPFNALSERNDYEIPWALRDLIADEKVASLFADEIVALRDAFRDWHPKTSILRDVKKKLQPIQRLSSALITSNSSRL